MLDLPDQDNLIVALDTEGSGLHPDDGARLSTVQVAWSGGCPTPCDADCDADCHEAHDIPGKRSHPVGAHGVESRVFFFDQGPDTWLGPKTPLPKKYPGRSLFEQDRNLGLAEWEELTAWLARQQLVFHNAQHDLHMLSAGLRGKPESGVNLAGSYIWDTMVVAPLLWPNEKVSLDFLGRHALGHGKEGVSALNEWRRKYLGLRGEHAGRYDLVPDDILEPYARQDPELTLELYQAEHELISEGWTSWEAVDREIDLAYVLYQMRRVGVGFAVDLCRREDARLQQMEWSAMVELENVVRVKNPTEAAMRDFWFKQLGLTPTKTTEKGEAQVTLEVVRDLVKDHVPGAAEWQTLNKIRTARKMWYTPWPKLAGPDGRLRPMFRQVKSAHDISDDSGPERGTISGRLAVERWQAQAIPHNHQLPDGVVPIRKMFRARPGHTIVEVDVSQAEMRGVAGLANCVGLLERFRAGEHAHTATTKVVFEVDEENPRWDFYRGLGKRLNLAIVYGAGIETLARQIHTYTGMDVTTQEVEGWWAEAKRSMPEIFTLSRAMRKMADAHRQVPLVGGRTRFFAPFEFTHKAMNARIQGSVAVAMADAMIEVVRGFGNDTLLLQIHDSMVLEFPTEHAPLFTTVVQGVICDTFERHFGCPFEADAKTWDVGEDLTTGHDHGLVGV